MGNSPMGMLTPTNSPFCRAGPVEGTRLPSKMPIAMARMIHSTKNLSRRDRPFKGGTASASSLTESSVKRDLVSTCNLASESLHVPSVGGGVDAFSRSGGVPTAV